MSDARNNNININIEVNRKITVLASDIIKKFKTKQDRISFCKENSKSKYIIFIDLYFPDESGFDSTFFLLFLRGEKKVNNFYYIFIATTLIDERFV